MMRARVASAHTALSQDEASFSLVSVSRNGDTRGDICLRSMTYGRNLYDRLLT